jgi:hypothetical protein
MDAEINHTVVMRAAHLSRLHALEKQQARFGFETPAHVTLEIEELRESIRLAELSLSDIVPEYIVTELGPIGRFRSLHKDIRSTRQRSNEAIAGASGQIEHLKSDLNWFSHIVYLWLGILTLWLLVLSWFIFVSVLSGRL